MWYNKKVNFDSSACVARTGLALFVDECTGPASPLYFQRPNSDKGPEALLSFPVPYISVGAPSTTVFICWRMPVLLSAPPCPGYTCPTGTDLVCYPIILCRCQQSTLDITNVTEGPKHNPQWTGLWWPKYY